MLSDIRRFRVMPKDRLRLFDSIFLAVYVLSTIAHKIRLENETMESMLAGNKSPELASSSLLADWVLLACLSVCVIWLLALCFTRDYSTLLTIAVSPVPRPHDARRAQECLGCSASSSANYSLCSGTDLWQPPSGPPDTFLWPQQF